MNDLYMEYEAIHITKCLIWGLLLNYYKDGTAIKTIEVQTAPRNYFGTEVPVS